MKDADAARRCQPGYHLSRTATPFVKLASEASAGSTLAPDSAGRRRSMPVNGPRNETRDQHLAQWRRRPPRRSVLHRCLPLVFEMRVLTMISFYRPGPEI